MNREALDAWFAEADDVLTDWQPSDDAMIARVPEQDDVEAMAGDSYYVQGDDRYSDSYFGVFMAPIMVDLERVYAAYFDSVIRRMYVGEGRLIGIADQTFSFTFHTDSPPPVQTTQLERAARHFNRRLRRRAIPPPSVFLDEAHIIDRPNVAIPASTLDRRHGPTSRRGLDGFHR